MPRQTPVPTAECVRKDQANHRYSFPFHYQGHLTPLSQVKGRILEALPASVSTDSAPPGTQSSYFFYHGRWCWGCSQSDILQLTHPCKSQDTRKVTLHTHLQRREWCLMKSFQGNVLPFYLYWFLEPKRERIWLSLNHFREILPHYIII